MSFEEAIATQPVWVQMWLNWMGLVIVGTFIGLLFSKGTRRDAAVIFVTTILVYFAMTWLYRQVGFVRLLGIIHVIVWTPLVYYLWKRLESPLITKPFRGLIWVFLATITVSLIIDYIDVARYILGEKASLVPGLS